MNKALNNVKELKLNLSKQCREHGFFCHKNRKKSRPYDTRWIIHRAHKNCKRPMPKPSPRDLLNKLRTPFHSGSNQTFKRLSVSSTLVFNNLKSIPYSRVAIQVREEHVTQRHSFLPAMSKSPSWLYVSMLKGSPFLSSTVRGYRKKRNKVYILSWNNKKMLSVPVVLGGRGQVGRQWNTKRANNTSMK